MRRLNWDVLVPPGSSLLVGLILGVAGIQTGLQAEQTWSEVLAVRLLFTQGYEPFASALAALPDSPPIIWGVHAVMAALFLSGFGGWTRALLDEQTGHEPSADGWTRGSQQTPAAIAVWLVGLTLGGLLALGACFALLVLFRGVHDGTLPWGTGSAVAAWVAGTGLASVLLVTASTTVVLGTLAAVERIHHPHPVNGLMMRAWSTYRRGKGGATMSRVIALWIAWNILRIGLLQAAVPAIALPPQWLPAWSVGGTILAAVMNLGDGMMLIWSLREACRLYLRGMTRT